AGAGPDLENRLAVPWLEDPMQMCGRMVSPGYGESPSQEMRHRGGMPDAPVPGEQGGGHGRHEPSGGRRPVARHELDEGRQARAEYREAGPVVASHGPATRAAASRADGTRRVT